MERLTPLQKLILERLNKDSSKYIEWTVLFVDVMGYAMNEKGVKHVDDFRIAIEGLNEMKFIVLDNRSNSGIRITEKGIEMLQENFITRFTDAVHDNPLKAASVGITLILGILGLIIALLK